LQRRRRARRWLPRSEARDRSTLVDRASRRAERNKSCFTLLIGVDGQTA
jgi:hypothetical protein